MSAAKPKSIAWFPDTSALITLAVHQPLHAAVVNALSGRRTVLMGAVVRELEDLTAAKAPVAAWARIALEQLKWLGPPVALDDPVGTDLAVTLQEEVSAGRPLTYPGQHYGVTPLSVHRLLHTMIAAQRITADEAASYAQALTDAHRSSDYSAEELKTGRLGRAGQP